MSLAAAKSDEVGVAKIKSEFLLLDYKPVLNTEYVSAAVKEQLKEASNPKESGDNEPPSKRFKLKGRNKQRPKGNKTIAMQRRLCPTIIAEKECSFGDNCKYLHDKKVYVETEPPNIGKECYLFKTYGKCPYGVTCRFSQAHLTEDLTNISKDDFESYPEPGKATLNVLSKDLQVKLWKRRYDFSKADQVLDWVCPGDNDQRRRRELPLTAKPELSVKPPAEAADGPDEGETADTGQTDSVSKSGDDVNAGVEKETGAGDDGATAQGSASSSTPTVERGLGDVSSEASISGAGDTVVDHGQSEGVIRLRPQEKKKINFTNKLYLAPLTTVGNLPFRRVCKRYGADVTCGEMAVCTNLLQGQQSEWALLKRHESEDLFGVQLCGAYPDSMTRCAQLITENMDVDFIDINCGCPIDLIFHRGEGSALMSRVSKFEQIIKGMTSVMDVPLTVKLRTGVYTEKNTAHQLMPKLRDMGVALTTLHGRSRMQRYTKTADWDYIAQCAAAAWPMPVFGNGDILSYEEVNLRREQSCISGVMLARGALIKPWIFTEIKEQRHWDISAQERYDMLKDYVNFGLDHWGSDTKGVENTRRFLLEWLSFLYRYIPVGLLERIPQQINERPPWYKGRNDLETLMASPSCEDWIKISEMLLGPVPEGFSFLPKHKANAYK